MPPRPPTDRSRVRRAPPRPAGPRRHTSARPSPPQGSRATQAGVGRPPTAGPSRSPAPTRARDRLPLYERAERHPAVPHPCHAASSAGPCSTRAGSGMVNANLQCTVEPSATTTTVRTRGRRSTGDATVIAARSRDATAEALRDPRREGGKTIPSASRSLRSIPMLRATARAKRGRRMCAMTDPTRPSLTDWMTEATPPRRRRRACALRATESRRPRRTRRIATPEAG